MIVNLHTCMSVRAIATQVGCILSELQLCALEDGFAERACKSNQNRNLKRHGSALTDTYTLLQNGNRKLKFIIRKNNPHRKKEHGSSTKY